MTAENEICQEAHDGEQHRESLGAGDGSTPSLVSMKRKFWPHVGSHDDVLRICVNGPDYVSAWFIPQCPNCKRTKHPNVTRSVGLPPQERHCNHCRIRWSHISPEPFCSCHGSAGGVLNSLLYGERGLLGRVAHGEF